MALVPTLLLDQRHVSELAQRDISRVARRHSGRDMQLDLTFEVIAHLGIEFLLDAIAPKK
jgi:hypothetical protein